VRPPPHLRPAKAAASKHTQRNASQRAAYGTDAHGTLAATMAVKTVNIQNPAGIRQRGVPENSTGRANTSSEPKKESISPGA
jgi:hypothetical protein